MNGKYILLYDQDCPLCKAYTNLFVTKGFIDKTEHISFQKGIDRYRHLVNEDRAHNEIACIDLNTNNVFYGAKGFFKVLGQRYPLLERISNWPIFSWLIEKCYFFISYNRNIIVKKQGVQCACEPSENWTYRLLFIALTFWFTAVHVQHYFDHYFTAYVQEHPVPDAVLMLLQYGVLTSLFLLFKQRNIYDYLGTIAFTTFIGGIILALGNGAFYLLSLVHFELGMLPEILYGIVFFVLLNIHYRRCTINGWSHWMSVCWLLFRIAIYFLVFNY